MEETLLTVLGRWSRQGKTDQGLLIDDRGKEILVEVMRILPEPEIEKPLLPDLNRQHRNRLLRLMWDKFGHYSNELDEYVSKLFERPLRGSLRIVVHIATHAIPAEGDRDTWYWDDMTQQVHYPASPTVSFEFFAACILHEIAHGLCYLLLDYEAVEEWYKEERPAELSVNWRKDEEELCWEVSRFICGLLGIEFDETAIPVCVRCGRTLNGLGRPYCEHTGYKSTCLTSKEAAAIERRNREIAEKL